MKAKKDQRQRSQFSHWTQQQNLHYLFYLIMKEDKLSQSQKNKIFKDMHKYIPTKRPRQCISHNQKLLDHYKSYQKIILVHLKEFYWLRFIELKHMMVEIQYFLNQKEKIKVIDSFQRQHLLEKARKNLLKHIQENQDKFLADLESEPQEESSPSVNSQPIKFNQLKNHEQIIQSEPQESDNLA